MTCRDASYTTQPLELLNDLGFQNSNMPAHHGDAKSIVGDGHVESYSSANNTSLDGSEEATASHLHQNNGADSLQSSDVSEGQFSIFIYFQVDNKEQVME